MMDGMPEAAVFAGSVDGISGNVMSTGGNETMYE
jgi:hypothetical protein